MIKKALLSAFCIAALFYLFKLPPKQTPKNSPPLFAKTATRHPERHIAAIPRSQERSQAALTPIPESARRIPTEQSAADTFQFDEEEMARMGEGLELRRELHQTYSEIVAHLEQALPPHAFNSLMDYRLKYQKRKAELTSALERSNDGNQNLALQKELKTRQAEYENILIHYYGIHAVEELRQLIARDKEIYYSYFNTEAQQGLVPQLELQ